MKLWSKSSKSFICLEKNTICGVNDCDSNANHFNLNPFHFVEEKKHNFRRKENELLLLCSVISNFETFKYIWNDFNRFSAMHSIQIRQSVDCHCKRMGNVNMHTHNKWFDIPSWNFPCIGVQMVALSEPWTVVENNKEALLTIYTLNGV